MTKLSLNQRIISSALMVLILFVSLTATALNEAFKNSSRNALKNTLTSQLYALLATANVDVIELKPNVNMPSDSLEALLGLPNSGLYAQIIDHNNRVLWQSGSFINASPPSSQFIASGQKTFKQIDQADSQFFQLSFGTNWLIADTNIPLTFVINQNLSFFNQQLSDYSDTLWLWLGGMALFLIVSQLLILRWGLSPINQVVDELHNIENGSQTKIERHYPQEIDFLSRNINHLLEKEHAQKKRYRNALGDLAHSLKTPLAVLQSSLSSNSKPQVMADQIHQMNKIVEYQLQKAATAGANNLSQAIDINLLINRIIDSLKKVYVDKQLSFKFSANKTLNFKADEGDMMEMFGNLLDNACKWAQHTIIISAHLSQHKLRISIKDDGQGFPEPLIEQLKIRGERADQKIPGHGIGLSIVINIIDSYDGELHLHNNTPEKGAEVIVIL